MYGIHAISLIPRSTRGNRQEELLGAGGNPKRMDGYHSFLFSFQKRGMRLLIRELTIMLGAKACGHVSKSQLHCQNCDIICISYISLSNKLPQNLETVYNQPRGLNSKKHLLSHSFCGNSSVAQLADRGSAGSASKTAHPHCWQAGAECARGLSSSPRGPLSRLSVLMT